MKVLSKIVFAVSFMFATYANANVILSLDPATQDANVGDVVSVTVSIGGLGNFVPLSLGAFDIDVAFDTDVLSFAGYNLGNELGDLDFFEAFDASLGEWLPGVVNISEVSFLSNFELWDLQPSSFVLGELLFTVNDSIGNLTSALSFIFADLVDANGDTINIVGVNNASVSVSVSAPATFALLSLGLLAMFGRQKYGAKVSNIA